MKSRWDEGRALKALTPELEDRLYVKLFDITEELLDIRDKVLEIYESLEDFINHERGQAYCLRLLRQLDTPIRTIRREVCKEKNITIWPKASRVRKEIVELMKNYQL